MSVFVMRDGTMLSMSASPYSGILNPIYMRLENVDGLLRRTCDVSMLLEAVLDVGECGILSDSFGALT